MRLSWRRDYPETGRIYAIGDVHGRLDQLEALLSWIRKDNADRPPRRTGILMLGNLIDYGPDAEAVLDLCVRLSDESDLFAVLKGRHEALMIAALRQGGDLLTRWLTHGGRATLRSMGFKDEGIDALPPRDQLVAARQAVSPEIVHWLDGLPDRWSAGPHLFRPSIACSKSTLSPAKQQLLVKDAAFTLRLTSSLRILIRQKIMFAEAKDTSGADSHGESPPVAPLAAIGLERNRIWIIRSGKAATATVAPR